MGFGGQPANKPAIMGGIPQPQPAAALAPNQSGSVDQLLNSVLHCSLLGDERDSVLAKWNMLQASWGSGLAFHALQQPPLTLEPTNPICRFKTIGYCCIPSSKDEDGIVTCIIKKPCSELTPQKSQIAAGINSLLGNRPNVKVEIDRLKSAGATSTEVTFYVTEVSGIQQMTRRIPAKEIETFLASPAQAANAQRLGFESIAAKVAFTEGQIKDYLENPPLGIDPRLWKQAQLDNPDPKKLIPVPMIGFKDLQTRIGRQSEQGDIHSSRLHAISACIADVQKRHQDAVSNLRGAKRKQAELAHRILHVIAKQEETRKVGFTIQPEEEKLRVKLETLNSEISAPTQFKGRLNEILSNVRLQAQSSTLSGSFATNPVDVETQENIKNVLRQQQNGLQALINMVQEDLTHLEIIQHHHIERK